LYRKYILNIYAYNTDVNILNWFLSHDCNIYYLSDKLIIKKKN
jgi:hypothetical protein